MQPQEQQVGQPTADPLDHITTSTTPARLARSMGCTIPAARAALAALVSAGELVQRGEEFIRPAVRRPTLFGVGAEQAAEDAVLDALRQHASVGDSPNTRDLAITSGLTDREAGDALERLRQRVEVLATIDRRGVTWHRRNPNITTAEQLWRIKTGIKPGEEVE